MSSIQPGCILNFRDVAVSSNSGLFPKGRVFRSARLDNAEVNDLKILVFECNICTIIDLRTWFEARTVPMIQAVFPRTPLPNTLLDYLDSSFTSASELTRMLDPISSDTRESLSIRRSFNIDIMGREYRMKAIWNRASFKMKLLVFLYIILFMKRAATTFVSRNIIARTGLLGLYKDLIDFCQPQLLMSMKVILFNAHEPFLIHCSHGKDRTGVVTALLLSVIGVPRKDIISDYAATSKSYFPIQKHVDAEFESVGFNRDFATAREETMDSLLLYIEAKYGSVTNYLEEIGFDQSQQNELRMKLAVA
ncbi:hypothetical protein DSO57_1024436 [Entomophthora muscae]|uniref:Uncharacterized protein n=1 Tax=Entomophthora muscae TaxID=34485 RepID=A0ACC2UMG4_9FUNG|nr:hypothetical protein DSO57_1024436 [Entomophthora muscae]